MSPEEMRAAAVAAETEAADIEKKALQQVTEFMNNINYQIGTLRGRAQLLRELLAPKVEAAPKPEQKAPDLAVLPSRE